MRTIDSSFLRWCCDGLEVGIGVLLHFACVTLACVLAERGFVRGGGFGGVWVDYIRVFGFSEWASVCGLKYIWHPVSLGYCFFRTR
jgi:hypothetical protein